LALALPMELRDSIVRRTVEGDSVLAAAMRLKFFGELDLLSTPAAVSSSTVATHAPAILAASSQASISKRDMSTSCTTWRIFCTTCRRAWHAS
jgi:hypothetical protein